MRHRRHLSRRQDQCDQRREAYNVTYPRPMERRLRRQPRRRDDGDEVRYHRPVDECHSYYQTDERHLRVEDCEMPVREERAVGRETGVSSQKLGQ